MIPLSARSILNHPASRMLGLLWLVAAGWLVARGFANLALAGLLIALGVGLLCWITIRITEPPPEPLEIPLRDRRWLWPQVVLLMLIIVITASNGLAFHRMIARPISVPIWSDVVNRAGVLGERTLKPEWVGGPFQALANPTSYAILPLLLLWPATRLRYLGLGPGHRQARVGLLWCAIPVCWVVYLLVSGKLLWTRFLGRLLSNTLQNGPFEEFLFRGSLQTRLQILLDPIWGVVLSSLAFGVWHLGLGCTTTGRTSLIDGLAATLMIQTTSGVGFAVIRLRTRNLVAGSVFHVLSNAAA